MLSSLMIKSGQSSFIRSSTQVEFPNLSAEVTHVAIWSHLVMLLGLEVALLHLRLHVLILLLNELRVGRHRRLDLNWLRIVWLSTQHLR